MIPLTGLSSIILHERTSSKKNKIIQKFISEITPNEVSTFIDEHKYNRVKIKITLVDKIWRVNRLELYYNNKLFGSFEFLGVTNPILKIEFMENNEIISLMYELCWDIELISEDNKSMFLPFFIQKAFNQLIHKDDNFVDIISNII